MTHSRAKPYSAPPGKYGNHSGGLRTSGGLQLVGGSSQPINRVSQSAGRGNGGSGAPAIVTTPLRCGKCGRLRHIARECTDSRYLTEVWSAIKDHFKFTNLSQILY